MIDERNDVMAFSEICGANNSGRFVERNIDGAGFGKDGFPINANDVPGKNPVACFCRFVVDRYPVFGDDLVGFASGTNSGFADKLVETHGFLIGPCVRILMFFLIQFSVCTMVKTYQPAF